MRYVDAQRKSEKGIKKYVAWNFGEEENIFSQAVVFYVQNWDYSCKHCNTNREIYFIKTPYRRVAFVVTNIEYFIAVAIGGVVVVFVVFLSLISFKIQ